MTTPSTRSTAAPARSAGAFTPARRSRAPPPSSTTSSTSPASITGPTGSSPRAAGYARSGRTASTRPPWPGTAGSISSASAGSTRSGRRGDPLGQRELERERRALVRIGLDPDPAVHRTDELPADVEPEAASPDAAPMVGIEAIELLEDSLLLA